MERLQLVRQDRKKEEPAERVLRRLAKEYRKMSRRVDKSPPNWEKFKELYRNVGRHDQDK